MEGGPHDARGNYGTSYMPSVDPGTRGGGTYNGESLEPTIEAYENIFGPSARDIKTDLQRFKRHGRWHLPDILKGPNQYLTDRIDGLITDATNSPFTSVILPYEYITNVDGKIKWNVWSFDEGLASRVPYESAARTLTQTKRAFAGYAVRQGMAIVLEHNFMMSDAGRQNFKNQLNQLIGSIQMTNDLDVHTALVLAPSYHAHMREKYIADDKTPSQVCREFIDLFGFMQKNVNALDILIEEAKSQLQVWGSPMPDFMLANSKLTFNMQMTPERTSYVTQGPEGQKRLNTGPNISSYRGIGIIHTRAFSMETGAPPRDILRRRVRVAEYYRIAPHEDNRNRIFQLYNEERDTWFGMPFKDLLKFSHLGEDIKDIDSYHDQSTQKIKNLTTQMMPPAARKPTLDKNMVRMLCMQHFNARKPRRALGAVASWTGKNDAITNAVAIVDSFGTVEFNKVNTTLPASTVYPGTDIQEFGKYVIVPGHIPPVSESNSAWFADEHAANPKLCKLLKYSETDPDGPSDLLMYKYNAIQEYPADIEFNDNTQAVLGTMDIGLQKALYRHMFSYGRLPMNQVVNTMMLQDGKLGDLEAGREKFFKETIRTKIGAFFCPNLHFAETDVCQFKLLSDAHKLAYYMYLTEEDCDFLLKENPVDKIANIAAFKQFRGVDHIRWFIQRALNDQRLHTNWNPAVIQKVVKEAMDDMRDNLDGAVKTRDTVFAPLAHTEYGKLNAITWTWPSLSESPSQDISYPWFKSVAGSPSFVLHEKFTKELNATMDTGVNKAVFDKMESKINADGSTAFPLPLFMSPPQTPILKYGVDVTDEDVQEFIDVIEWRLLVDRKNTKADVFYSGRQSEHTGEEGVGSSGGDDVVVVEDDGGGVVMLSKTDAATLAKADEHIRKIIEERVAAKTDVTAILHEVTEFLIKYVDEHGMSNMKAIRSELAVLDGIIRSISAGHPPGHHHGYTPGTFPPGPSAPPGGSGDPMADVEIVILRPNIEHYMFGIILGKGGKQLGSTFWGQTELSCYDDSQHGIWGMSYKYHERAIVINERNLVRLWDIGYDGYVGGKDDKHLQWDDPYKVRDFKDKTLEVTKHYRGPSMLVMAFSHHKKNDPAHNATYQRDFKQNWPSPIVMYDDRSAASTSHTIGSENNQNMDTSEFRVFTNDLYNQRYQLYKEHMPPYNMLHTVRKNAGQASAEGEASTDALAFQGSMRITNTQGSVIQEIHGSGHHGPDFVGVASLRAGKGYKVSTQPTTQRLV